MAESTFYMPSPNILLYYTMDGARLLCTQCESILDAPKLKVTSQHNNYQNGYLWANKTDYLADINIPAFSSCKTLGQCPAIMRNITPWMETKDDLLSNGHPTVLCNENNLGLLSSYCYCRTGNGFIYPLTSGQNPMDMDPTQLTFDDIFFLLDQGNQKALDYINQHKDVIQNTIQDYFEPINESWINTVGSRGNKLRDPELLASDYLNASITLAQNRLDGKKNIMPPYTIVPEDTNWFAAAILYAGGASSITDDVTIDHDTTAFQVWRMTPANVVASYAGYHSGQGTSASTAAYLSKAKEHGIDIPYYPELSQTSLLILARGKASEESEWRQLVPILTATLASIGLVAAPYLAPFLVSSAGYAITTASTLIAAHPIIGNALYGAAEGGGLAFIDSLFGNTTLTTDANGLPSFLQNDWRATGVNTFYGATSGAISNGIIGAAQAVDQGYNNWLNAPNTIGGNSRIPLSFAPNEPFASSAFDQQPSAGKETDAFDTAVKDKTFDSFSEWMDPAESKRYDQAMQDQRVKKAWEVAENEQKAINRGFVKKSTGGTIDSETLTVSIAKDGTVAVGLSNTVDGNPTLPKKQEVVLNKKGSPIIDRKTGQPKVKTTVEYSDYVQDKLGSVQGKPSKTTWSWDNCAENKSISELTKKGYQPNEITTVAIDVDAGTFKPPCKNCRILYGNDTTLIYEGPEIIVSPPQAHDPYSTLIPQPNNKKGK